MVYDQLGSIPDGSRGPTSTGRAWPKVMVLADAQALTKWMACLPEVRSWERRTLKQSADLYELTLSRHRAASFVIASNQTVDEWLSLFDDPILGNSALDRLANASCQTIIEGASYREKLWPRRKLLGERGGDLPLS